MVVSLGEWGVDGPGKQITGRSTKPAQCIPTIGDTGMKGI
jgi:hypothetical protein